MKKSIPPSKEKEERLPREKAATVQGTDSVPVFRVTMSDITAQKRAEEALRDSEKRLSFEELMLDISTRFINLPPELIGGEIENVQSTVCQSLGIEHCTLWQWSQEGPRGATLTHAYRPYGGPPHPLTMKAYEHLPWAQLQIEAGKIVSLSSIEDMPDGAERDRETWRHFGIKSGLSLPLSSGGKIIGALNFSTVTREYKWPESLIRQLQLISQVFTNALIRKQVEEALRESVKRLSDVVFSMAEWVWEVDTNGFYTYSSSKGEELFETVIGKTPFDFMPPDEARRVAAIFSEIAANKAPIKDLENWKITKDGERICLLTSGVPLLDAQGDLKGYRGVDKDVTDRIQNRQRLEEQLRFETLLSDISGHFINLPFDQVDSEIEAAQRRVCECLGLDLSVLWQYSAETPRTLILTHFYRPLGGPSVPDPMFAHEHFPWSQQQVEAGRIIAVSSLEELPPEAFRDLEANRRFGIKSILCIPLSAGGGSPIGILTYLTVQNERTWTEMLIKRLQMVAQMFTNALIRKQNEVTLRESEARLGLTTEAVGAGLWVMEADAGKVWVSPTTRELFHFAPDEEITYESFFKVIHPDDRERVDRTVQQTLQSGEPLRHDFRIVLPDGNIKWISARGKRNLKSAGKPDCIMGLSLDISERKGLELRLMESRTLLEALVNSTQDMIWSVDSERFGLLTFNRGLYDFFLDQRGIQIKAGMRPEDLFPTEDYVRQWRTFYRKALHDGSFTAEYQVFLLAPVRMSPL
ncbi:MAG: PAS domain S-box protein [Deltaproteobacteria bacterium]|nr:PAS domain S-box protein [Deltaproteobacteria bacterium]